MSIRVLNDNVLVQVENATENKSESGLYVPKPSEGFGQILKGTVKGVGKGRLTMTEHGWNRAKPDVEVGDMVWFPKVNATQIEVEGQVFFVIPESAISAVKTRA